MSILLPLVVACAIDRAAPTYGLMDRRQLEAANHAVGVLVVVVVDPRLVRISLV
jgi:hypothetical protein